MKYTQRELDEILEKHKRWLNDNPYGKKANLIFANLRRKDLRWADLRRTDLRWTDLSGTDLSGADLSGADLSGADLRRADLTNTKLDNAKLNWVNSDEIKGYTVYCVQMPILLENTKLSYWKELNTWTTGCFQGTKEELTNSINKKHKDNEKIRKRYFKAIAFIESMASEK